jgi:hypothetical protein
MVHFERIGSVPIHYVSGALKQLAEHPELWDQIPLRTAPGSPHEHTSDIWVRFRDMRECSEPKHFGEPHFPVFYPAWWAIPAIQQPVYSLMAQLRATHLGGILITKIPAGKQVKPHADAGWHPTFYNTKVYIPLQSNPKCVNTCLDEQIVIGAGEAVLFDNLNTHSVINAGDSDRVTLIVTMRTEHDPI